MQEQAKLLEKQICPYCRNAYRPDWERMGFPNGRRKRKPRQTGALGGASTVHMGEPLVMGEGNPEHRPRGPGESVR